MVVFSQWKATLDHVARRLQREGISYVSLGPNPILLAHLTHLIDGAMNEKHRARVLESFNSEEKCSVFLLSIRIGSVGISLTAAQHIFLMDHCLNRTLSDLPPDRVISRWRSNQ